MLMPANDPSHRGGWTRAAAHALRRACEADVQALKPGNVSVHSAGHGMHAADFLASADAIVTPLCAPGVSVGARILAAVRATRRAVPMNTNLGIVLLSAPIVHAWLARRPAQPLRSALCATLDALTVDDARDAFEAICLAAPGGLGDAACHDVRAAPQVTLREAMIEAAGRDRIARQYATGFFDVWDVALPLARDALARWQSTEWTAVAVYLGLLARFPDTHIVRKHGIGATEHVRREAAPLADALMRLDDPRLLWERLGFWDARLKAAGLNPGTSADLTVATLLANSLEDAEDGVFPMDRRRPG